MFDSYLEYNYGRFLLKRNRLEEARKHLNRAVELTPKTRAVHYERARLNLRPGNNKQARLDAERTLTLADPGKVIMDMQVYFLLSRIYSRLGEHELSHKYIEMTRKSGEPLVKGTPNTRGGR